MFVEVNKYDHSGRQQFHVVREQRTRIGRGWIAVFKKEFLSSMLSLSELQLKTLLVLSAKQSYDPFVVITPLKIAEILKASYNRTAGAVRDLIRRRLIRKVNVDGVMVFMINPALTICGTSTLEKRREIWQLLDRVDDLDSLIKEIDVDETISEDDARRLEILKQQLAIVRSTLKEALDNREVNENNLLEADPETGELKKRTVEEGDSTNS